MGLVMTQFSIFLWNAILLYQFFPEFVISTIVSPPMHVCALRDILELWFLKHTIHVVHCYVLIFVYWCIWLCRNKSIFEDKTVMILDTLHQIDYFMHYYPVPGIKTKSINIGIAPILVFPCGFFMELLQSQRVGRGSLLPSVVLIRSLSSLAMGLQQILEQSFWR